MKILEAENIPENADVTRVMENMISLGAKLIVPASFGYLDPGLDVASKHPDVMFDHPAGFKQAENFGFHSTAVQKYAPKGWISGIGFTWGEFFGREVQAIEQETWKSNPKNRVGDLNSDMVALGPWGSAAPADVRAIVESKIAELKAGKAQVFAGPIKDNKGTLRIPAGQVGDPSLLKTFDWFVEGVIANAS